jgi:hypothetical protein
MSELEDVTPEHVPNYMPIVRALIKMSSALNEADEVMEGKYYKFDFKVQFRRWVEVFEVSSKKLISEFMSENSDALQDAYVRFLEFTKDIKVKDEDRTSLILLYCKLKSSLNDLEEVPLMDGGIITLVIKIQTTKVINAIEKQYKGILEVLDSENNSIQVIIDQYDELGKTMFVKE